MFRFSIRSLLVVTALVGVTLGLGAHYWRWERLAALHTRQAELVAGWRNQLFSVSFDVPDSAWQEIDRQEAEHQRLAKDYRRKIWQPWLAVTPPPKPLPIQVEGTDE